MTFIDRIKELFYGRSTHRFSMTAHEREYVNSVINEWDNNLLDTIPLRKWYHIGPLETRYLERMRDHTNEVNKLLEYKAAMNSIKSSAFIPASIAILFIHDSDA